MSVCLFLHPHDNLAGYFRAKYDAKVIINMLLLIMSLMVMEKARYFKINKTPFYNYHNHKNGIM